MLHPAAAGNLVYWPVLALAAAATRDPRLTEPAGLGPAEPAQRRLRRTEAVIKNLAAHALTHS
ncbi:hypothetical protein ACF07V_06065 [Streptomyces sp. NPDC015661]|uniref:hypothetical protein n=1 Tax=Streptomyces sp. NPDC015661 TaxID=3364961 RepID=UPI0036F4FBC2